MTEQLAKAAEDVLKELGFSDKSESATWNVIQMERDFGEIGRLAVWGRDWSLPIFQFTQGDENMVQFGVFDDVQQLRVCVERAIEFISSLPPCRDEEDA